MAALDCINDRNVKKLKYHDQHWDVRGDVFVLDGKELGPIDWPKSRFLKVGKEVCYYAHVGGQYYVVLERMQVGFKPRPKMKWGVPEPVDGGEDE